VVERLMSDLPDGFQRRGTNTWRLAMVALVGAALVEVVLVVSEGVGEAFAVRKIPDHLAALAVGALLGWMYELLRELNAATLSSLRDIDSLQNTVKSLTNKINYQDDALSMLTSCPRHNAVLTALIRASMRDNFRNVPYVGEAEYLQFLHQAIEHSNGYQGIQRKPLGWFRDMGASTYLASLRERRMAYKTRIFVIDDEDLPEMEHDLADPDLLDYYWRHTGDVDSFWISVSNFKRHCPRIRVPDDFGLYDGSLLIVYDTERQVLTFNLLDESDVERQIFATQRSLADHGVAAFRVIPREPATGEEPA